MMGEMRSGCVTVQVYSSSLVQSATEIGRKLLAVKEPSNFSSNSRGLGLTGFWFFRDHWTWSPSLLDSLSTKQVSLGESPVYRSAGLGGFR